MNKDADILEKLEDLLLQATTERSHYYTSSVLREALVEICSLRLLLNLKAKKKLKVKISDAVRKGE